LVLSQRAPQPPQLVALVLVLVSQPLPDMPSQSASGAVHTEPTMQVEPAQKGVRPDGAVQRLLHVPQLATSVATLVSQPSVGSLLQSRKPEVHAPMVHTPDTHVDAALAKRQRLLHAPQLFASVAVEVSQPAAVLQSPKPARHAVWTHVADTHCDTALAKAPVHERAQAPQLALSLCALTQTVVVPDVQRVRPVGHTHAPPEQNWPAGQMVPQAPQLFESVWRLKHPAAPHEV
jgi:hypothetical protein